MRKSVHRNKSPKRSRSRSPRFGRNRSRSPDIDHIARKRERDTFMKWSLKGALVDEPLRQPYPPYKRIYPNPKKRLNGNRNNGISDQNKTILTSTNNSFDQDKSETKVEQTATVQSQNDHDKNGIEVDKIQMDVDQENVKEQNPVEQQTKREKTEQEIEDELLASTDEEDDGDQIELTVDENELDFLDDDEEESEGRFKSSKPVTQTTKSLPKPTYNKFSDKYNNKRNNKTYDTSRNNQRRPKSPIYQRKQDHSFKTTFRDKPSSSSASLNGSLASNSLKDNKETTPKIGKTLVSTVSSLAFKPNAKDGEF